MNSLSIILGKVITKCYIKSQLFILLTNSMNRNNDIRAHKLKRPKLQQSLKFMLQHSGPKVIEAPAVQRMCRYCKRKFLAPQGLAVHLHMHERAGDVPLPLRHTEKYLNNMIKEDNPTELASFRYSQQHKQRKPLSVIQPQSAPPQDVVVQAPVKKSVINERAVPPAKSPMMRRFTVAEKLSIIEKFRQSNNISGTCRWVREQFGRSTFDRKSLKLMVSREKIFREAKGTKKIRKYVKPRTGSFYKMDKQLAK